MTFGAVWRGFRSCRRRRLPPSAYVVPRLSARIGKAAAARRVVATTGFVGASACIIFTRIEDPVRAMFVLGMAGFFNDFIMPVAWASTMDIGGAMRAPSPAR